MASAEIKSIMAEMGADPHIRRQWIDQERRLRRIW